MIHQIDPSEKATSTLFKTMKKLKINTMLRKANITKSKGIAVNHIFQMLIVLTFYGKNLYRLLNSNQGLDMPSKDAFYRFLNYPKYAWRRFLLMLATKVISTFDGLTSQKRVKVFVLDDSLYSRERSKKVELLARVFDHTTMKFAKGFTMLTLGWSDGFSFIPIDFTMLSSAKEHNRLSPESDFIDKRSHGYKRRKEAIITKPHRACQMVDQALESGIHADYILMDTWFTNEPMIQSITLKGLDIIGMVKDLKQKYNLNGKICSLTELRSSIRSNKRSDIIGSLNVRTKTGIAVKLVFVKNRNKRKEWLVILSTDLSIDEKEVIRIYGMRWSIEVFFKSTKSLLKLGSEFQGRSYDMLVSHTTIVFTRYILLEWERRHHQDNRTLGGLFFLICDEVRDIDFKNALIDLLAVFDVLKKDIPDRIKELVSCQLNNWIQSQPSHIKVLLGELYCEN